MKQENNKHVFRNTGCVVDQETGEIYEPSTSNYTITIEEYTSLPTEEMMEVRSGNSFTKLFRGAGILLNQKLTHTEVAVAIFLSDFVCYSDCVLRTNGLRSGKALTIKDLAEMYGISYDNFRKIMSSLKKKEVIGYHETGEANGANSTKWITVNPFIFCHGVKVYPWVFDFYANTEWGKAEMQRIRLTKN